MKIYTHVQASPATTWSINHNLGCKPTFDVSLDENGGGVKAYPASVIHVTDNILQMTFSVARTGSVRLVGSPL